MEWTMDTRVSVTTLGRCAASLVRLAQMAGTAHETVYPADYDPRRGGPLCSTCDDDGYIETYGGQRHNCPDCGPDLS